jgi:hypothetical protein
MAPSDFTDDERDSGLINSPRSPTPAAGLSSPTISTPASQYYAGSSDRDSPFTATYMQRQPRQHSSHYYQGNPQGSPGYGSWQQAQPWQEQEQGQASSVAGTEADTGTNASEESGSPSRYQAEYAQVPLGSPGPPQAQAQAQVQNYLMCDTPPGGSPREQPASPSVGPAGEAPLAAYAAAACRCQPHHP